MKASHLGAINKYEQFRSEASSLLKNLPFLAILYLVSKIFSTEKFRLHLS